MYKLLYIAAWTVVFLLLADYFISSGIKHIRQEYKDKLRSRAPSMTQHLHWEDQHDFVDELLALVEELLDISRSTIKVVGYVLAIFLYLLGALAIYLLV